VTPRDGEVVASTRPAEVLYIGNLKFSSVLRGSDALWVEKPRKNPASQDWILQFGRRLNATEGTFAGAVLLEVDASYFVSGYEAAQLGKRGTLGFLGTDGVFRATPTGDELSAGGAVNYATTASGADQGDPTISLTSNTWDGIWRYTGTAALWVPARRSKSTRDRYDIAAKKHKYDLPDRHMNLMHSLLNSCYFASGLLCSIEATIHQKCEVRGVGE
jgi:hypothetical protein